MNANSLPPTPTRACVFFCFLLFFFPFLSVSRASRAGTGEAGGGAAAQAKVHGEPAEVSLPDREADGERARGQGVHRQRRRVRWPTPPPPPVTHEILSYNMQGRLTCVSEKVAVCGVLCVENSNACVRPSAPACPSHPRSMKYRKAKADNGERIHPLLV